MNDACKSALRDTIRQVLRRSAPVMTSAMLSASFMSTAQAQVAPAATTDMKKAVEAVATKVAASQGKSGFALDVDQCVKAGLSAHAMLVDKASLSSGLKGFNVTAFKSVFNAVSEMPEHLVSDTLMFIKGDEASYQVCAVIAVTANRLAVQPSEEGRRKVAAEGADMIKDMLVEADIYDFAMLRAPAQSLQVAIETERGSQ